MQTDVLFYLWCPAVPKTRTARAVESPLSCEMSSVQGHYISTAVFLASAKVPVLQQLDYLVAVGQIYNVDNEIVRTKTQLFKTKGNKNHIFFQTQSRIFMKS